MKWTITGYSTALFSTWYNIEELGLLFDAGDGITSGLLQKSRKIKHVFISHADRDHLTGLLQFNQLNAREGLTIYYPKDSGSFPFLAAFCKRFDPHVSGTKWIGIDDGQEIEIKKGIIVKAIRNRHVSIKDKIKSLSYKVYATKQKLKPQYLGLPGKAIQQLRETKGIENITEEIRHCIFGYSGDTPIEMDGRWKNIKILIHEATFLKKGSIPNFDATRNQHSYLDEVLIMAAASNIEQLILGHFSSRYAPDEILQAVEKGCRKYAVNCTVYCVLPGETKRLILN